MWVEKFYQSCSVSCLLIPLLVLCGSALAQVDIDGRVTDGHQELPGVSIRLLRIDSVFISGTVSDGEGRFHFKQVHGGHYLISASMTGFIKYTSAPILINQNRLELPELVLEENTTTLREVVIQTDKQVLEQQSDRLVVNIQNAVTNSGSTLLEALGKAPGVMINKQSNTISINGKSGVKIMINNKIVQVSPDVAVQMLDGMSAANVEKIELITTPSSRFDADGNGGIIHIVTKQNDAYGTNGSFGLMAGARWAEALGGNFSVNHRRRTSAYFIDYSITRNHNFHTLEIIRQLPESDFAHPVIVHADRENVTTQQNLSMGMEWTFKATTLKAGLTGYSRNWSLTALNDEQDQVTDDSSVTTHMRVRQSNIWKSATASLGVQTKVSPNSEISFGVDYLYYHNSNPSRYDNSAFEDDPATADVSTVDLTKKTPISFLVSTLDYQYRPTSVLTIETGLKAVNSELNNDVVVNRIVDDVWTLDPRYTSHSLLKETIYAAYAAANWHPKNTWLLTAGLRYEYTRTAIDTQGESSEHLVRKYGYLFPTFLLKKEIGSEKDIQFSYNRRITRPTYNDIASYAAFWSTNTFTAANISLWPAVSDALSVGYHHSRWTISLQFAKVGHEINALQPAVDVTSNSLTYRSQNLQYVNTVGLTNIYSMNIAPWWELQAYATTQYQTGETAHLEHDITFHLYGLNVNMVNVVKLPSDFTLELSGTYQSRTRSGTVNYLALGSLNAGIQKKFGRAGILRFAMDDILYTTNWRTKTFIPEDNLDVRFNYDWHNQFVRLTYSLNLGNTKLKSAKGKTGSDEERKRIGN